MSLYYNVTGSTGVTTELISPSDMYDVKTILLTNVHATADATVTLFIQNDPSSGTTNTYNIISTIAIPSDTALLLNDSHMFNIPVDYGLYITVGSSDTVDVSIST